MRIAFDHVGSGLMAARKEGPRDMSPPKPVDKLQGFAIAGADRKWHWADAVIDGDTVVVSAEAVPEPVAVRYAFSMNPVEANLYNREGLPASPSGPTTGRTASTASRRGRKTQRERCTEVPLWEGTLAGIARRC